MIKFQETLRQKSNQMFRLKKSSGTFDGGSGVLIGLTVGNDLREMNSLRGMYFAIKTSVNMPIEIHFIRFPCAKHSPENRNRFSFFVFLEYIGSTG